MKRYILIAMLVLIELPSAARKERRHSPFKYEVNIAWGGYPSMEWSLSESRKTISVFDNGVDYAYNDYLNTRKLTGLISADFNVQFKSWFALGSQINFMTLSNTLKSPQTWKTTKKYNDFSISLIPYARLTYLNRQYVKMYLSLGLGIGLNHDSYPSEGQIKAENLIVPRIQFVPIGITVGKRVYVMGELGFGTEYFGGRMGIGYRF